MSNDIHIQQFKPQKFGTAGEKVGGLMLSVTGLNWFYSLRCFSGR